MCDTVCMHSCSFSVFFVFTVSTQMHHVHVTVPVPPSGLTHDATSDTSVDISWSDQMSQMEQY